MHRGRRDNLPGDGNLRLPRPPRRRRRCARRGSIYLFVLLSAMLVTVIALGAITVSRINTRRMQGRRHRTEAKGLARSAVEAAVAAVNLSPAWRHLYLNDVETPQVSFGAGTISFKLVDEDGDLADDPADPVRVYGIGRVVDSVWVYSAALTSTTPLEALDTCIHCSGQLEIAGGETLTASGAPASTNSNFLNDGRLLGSIDAATRSGNGTVTGTINIPAPPKAFPPSSVFAAYVAKATVLPSTGTIDRCVLAPGVNEYGGGLNANGVYYINVPMHGLRIRRSRIHGTLVVNADTSTVTVENNVFMSAYRADYPVLIVLGNLQLAYDSDTPLSEGAEGHNFNPPGAPYLGEDDADQSDDYPSEIRGLVHCTGALLTTQTARVRGVILSESTARFEGAPSIIHDPSIAQNPPEGYTSLESELFVEPGSWRREPAP